ncbi:MAG: hypothetical protein OEY01_02970 [Desulfobulbaceae bacterium]|nr:hypothetical protein [Desulfobulbaceae bacterium]HIJ78253.1 hypothetical protein [Deltaproteobacteria bacterium]
MTARNKMMNWRLGYGVGCLVYLVWVVQLSFNNFGMVHHDYRSAEARLQPQRIEAMALAELVGQCRKEAGRGGRHRPATAQVVADPCRDWPAPVIAARQKAVAERLAGELSLAVRKLVLFYVSFGVIFLILPPVILYLLLSFFIWLYQGVKGGKDGAPS